METVERMGVQKHMRPLMALLMVVVIVALGAYTYKTTKDARYSGFGPNIITVQGEGEVFAIPDIATFTFSVLADAEDATAAQEKSAEAINTITTFLKESGVAENDIKTVGYYLNPKYEYNTMPCYTGWCPPSEPRLVGYEVNQTIEVKVRDTNAAGTLIAGVGDRGATNVGGLAFTIDDEETVKAEAREAAINDAKAKAEVLAENLGVRLVRMTGYYEENYPVPYYYGYGGGVDMAMEAAQRIAPSLPAGENQITSRVNISYEIR